MSQLTSHILDTSKGRPAAGIEVILYFEQENSRKEIARSITDSNGRVTDLLQKANVLPLGIYKLKFLTSDYFQQLDTATLYPYIEVAFQIGDSEHYHIPLLINPFGYSTYRGS